MNPRRRRLRRRCLLWIASRRLRGRPSGLKGRCAIADATGPRPALDPGASAAPVHATARAGPAALPEAMRGAQPKIPAHQVSTV